MCGIIGIISQENVVDRLITGLKSLEYRGYDSAGLGVNNGKKILTCRAVGKINALENEIRANPINGKVGIGHTRWATHGAPTVENAHPHSTDAVAVVHNGIIENFAVLKNELLSYGCIFKSNTDTEVVAHLITKFLQDGLSPHMAVNECIKKINGAFALAIIFNEHPDLMIATRKGSPLALGIEDNNLYLGSDALTLATWTKNICYLQDGDTVVLERNAEGNFSYEIFDHNQNSVAREIRQLNFVHHNLGKQGYEYFMLKEIFEQPVAIKNIMTSINYIPNHNINLPLDYSIFKNVQNIYLVACGSSNYAGMVSKYWLEANTKIPTHVDLASEFRYRYPVLSSNDLVIFISQSGETIDSLAALTLAKKQNARTLAIVNVPESSIARQADQCLYIECGPEIGVASTKAFTNQMTLMALLTAFLARNPELVNNLPHLIDDIQQVLDHHEEIIEVAKNIADSNSVLYLGRGSNYPIALEGALKLKELSYIHAEGYAAGELKHGPIALIDETLPVIVVAPFDQWFEKTISNVQEVISRGAKVIVFTDLKGKQAIQTQVANVRCIVLPTINNFLQPILFAVSMQLLAYYVACTKGLDVDKPRNLAKSVTVE